MTNESFETLVDRLGQLNARHPLVYRISVAILGLLGYVYIVAVVALLVTLAIAVGRTPPGLAGGPAVLWAVASLLVLLLPVVPLLRLRNEPASGVVLSQAVAPALHEAVESLRTRLAVPRIDGVLLGNGFNAETVLVPRCGSLLGFRRYLVLGLPLIVALRPAQLRAVIAHELGHLSSDHGFLNSRVYRIRMTWTQLVDGLSAQGRWTTAPFRLFFERYAPWFAAWSLVLARRHEYEADRRAASVTSREELAAGLLRTRVVQGFMHERFYPRMLKDIREHGVLPWGLHVRLERQLRHIREDPRFDVWVDSALRDLTNPRDSHPSLRDRLAALRMPVPGSGDDRALVDAAFAPAPEYESAVHQFLGESSEHLTVSIEKCWVDDARQSWAERHEELLRLDGRRKELDGRADLGVGETLEYVISTAETEGADAALPLARDLVERRPAMPPARFVLGRLLLDRNDAEGIDHLEAAMAGDRQLTEPGCHLIIEFLRANGRHDEVRQYLQRQGEAEPEPRVASPPAPQQKRTSAGPRIEEVRTARVPDPVTDKADRTRPEPHGLDARSLLLIKRKIAPMAAVARVWLVRGEIDAEAGIPVATASGQVKAGGAFPPHPAGPAYVLGIEPMQRRADADTIANRVAREVEFPGPTSIVVLTRRQRELRRHFEDVDGAMIFERTRRKTA